MSKQPKPTNPYWEKLEDKTGYRPDSFEAVMGLAFQALRWDIQKLREEVAELKRQQGDPYLEAREPKEEK